MANIADVNQRHARTHHPLQGNTTHQCELRFFELAPLLLDEVVAITKLGLQPAHTSCHTQSRVIAPVGCRLARPLAHATRPRPLAYAHFELLLELR